MSALALGQFRATCNLKRHVHERRLSADEIRDAREKGYGRRFVALVSERKDKETGRNGRWEVAFPACAGFDTTDKAAFEQHMATEHGRSWQTWHRGEVQASVTSVRRGWTSPRNRPLPAQAEALLKRCPTCDMGAEVNGEAAELWWTEHLRGCALAVSLYAIDDQSLLDLLGSDFAAVATQ